MNIKISNRLKNSLEFGRLGIFHFTVSIRNSGNEFLQLVDTESVKLRESINSEEITKNNIISDTRIAYKKCGKDPSRYRPSADSLMRRIVKGNNLYVVNNVVDVLNLVSIKSGYSIGGYDLSKVEGNVIFDIGLTSDVYCGIGRGLLNINGLPILRDEVGVFGSPTSDSERTMISEKTHQVAFVYFDFGCSKSLDETIKLTENYLSLYCEAEEFKYLNISF